MELDRAIELMQKKIKCLYGLDPNDLKRCYHTCKECELYMTAEEEEEMNRKALEIMEEYRAKEKKVRCISVPLKEYEVTCATCKFLRASMVGHPDEYDICELPLWEEYGKAPHVIWHSVFKPIRCDHWEVKEDKA